MTSFKSQFTETGYHTLTWDIKGECFGKFSVQYLGHSNNSRNQYWQVCSKMSQKNQGQARENQRPGNKKLEPYLANPNCW